MRSWKSVSLTIAGIALGLVVVAVVLGIVLRNFLVNLWWFDSLDYGYYFWLQVLYHYGVYAAGVVVLFVLFFANFWIGGRYLGASPPGDEPRSGQSPPRRIYRRFQRRSLAIYLPLTLVLAIVVALPLLYYWQRALMFLLAPAAGIDDPVFGLDVSFYLFSLPFYVTIFGEVAAALAIVLAGLLLLYGAEHRVMPRPGGGLRRGARVHLSVITFLLFVMGALYFVGDAAALLYTRTHEPLFYGPGYEEMTVTLPLILAALVLVLIVGGLTLLLLNTGKGRVALAASAVLLLAVVGLRYTPFITGAVHDYLVKPNEMTRQRPYIADNIDATLTAYRLNDVESRDYQLRTQPWEEITPKVRQNLKNVPIWNEEHLLPVYRELQEIRPYYAFQRVDVGRYTVEDVYQQVFLAAREIDLKALSRPLQTWVNRWLKYTHGYGVVMTPAAQKAAAPLSWFIHGIPPRSVAGLSIDEPALYYGNGYYHPVIAPNATHEVDYGSDDELHLTDYHGRGGVPVETLFRKLVFALYFADTNILFTTQTRDDSRLLFRRNVQQRIRALTPYLLLTPHPYVAIANGRLYWIQNAMTASSWYPYSTPYEGTDEQLGRSFNYIRDSVKVVVDAYNGSVDYYLSDPSDPIAATYARMFPGLFKPFDAMPEALKAHVRYPKNLFDVQMKIYARYHQTDPQVFYDQEDVWELPKMAWHESGERITSYYLTLNLIDPDRFEFTLFLPVNPLGKHNMRALALAGNDGDDYGRIIVYNLPKGELVYGPAQVDAFIKQDPVITQQLTLWNQQGSRARQGRMVVVPIEGVLTYIQGIFLETTGEAGMPQLARIVVSQGRLVVMESSVEAGFRALNRLIKREQQNGDAQQELMPPAGLPEVTPDTGGAGGD